MSQADREWAKAADETASPQTNSRYHHDDVDETAQRDTAAEGVEPRHALLLVSADDGQVAKSDWPVAIKLVESAATRIKAYERKFKAIEQDARAFMDRVDSEHQRLNAHIAALEEDLRKAENRALQAETDAQALKLETWEAKLSRRALERKLQDAEAEIRHSQKYLGQIEGLLGGL